MAEETATSYREVAERFPGIEQVDPQALGRFAFACAADFPDVLFYDATPYGDWQRAAWKAAEAAHEWVNRTDEKGSRDDLARSIAENYELDQETVQLEEKIKTTDSREGFKTVAEYLERWDFKLEFAYDKSPLFEDGRTVYRDMGTLIDRENETFAIPDGADIVRTDATGLQEGLSDEIRQYISDRHEVLRGREELAQITARIETVDAEELAGLRERFGAKAANLIAMQRALDTFYDMTDEDDGFVKQVVIPPFHPVGVEIFDQWQEQRPEWPDTVRALQSAACELVDASKGELVAVRSSAVYSEDGDEHTGAGVYESVAVDPNDAEAFMKAIVTVYESVNSSNAVAYRENAGIAQEKMGLVIQAYQETSAATRSISPYGYGNSVGTNPNVLEMHTQEGPILFDKNKVAASLMAYGRSEDFLHAVPDQGKLISRMVSDTLTVAHGALFAEKVFGRPVQVEYMDDMLVQVRPLPKHALDTANESVRFLEDQEPLCASKAFGVGDEILEELDNRTDNSDAEGFVIFDTEWAFTDTGSTGVLALPKKGAVLILGRADRGHIQTLCMEKGLLCFYADKESGAFEKFTEHWDERLDNEVEEPLVLRCISNGYEGRIYTVAA